MRKQDMKQRNMHYNINNVNYVNYVNCVNNVNKIDLFYDCILMRQ
jgi:hypothetical protein